MRARRGCVCAGWIGAALLFESLGCAPKDAYIMSQVYRITSDAAGPIDLTCANIASGSGSIGGGGRNGDFWIEEESSPSGLSVRAGSYEQEVATRFYDRAFISAHGIDTFVVTTHDGDEYAFVYWGGDSCERCPPTPVAYYPGAPWGCGSGTDAGIPGDASSSPVDAAQDAAE
jgi:hypothetical protein